MMMGMAEAMVIAPVLAKGLQNADGSRRRLDDRRKDCAREYAKQRVREQSRGVRKLSLERSGDTAPLIASMPYIRTAKP